MKIDYDIAIIGGGAGGLTAAKMAQGLGKKTVLIEKTDKLGGECTWTGCVPSKALIRSAQIAFYAKNMQNFGLNLSNNLSINAASVMPHVKEVIKQVYRTHTPEQIEKENIDVLFGTPTFLDVNHMQCNDKVVAAKKIIIATGSSPVIPPIEGIDDIDYLTNETLFSLETLPESMIILGGGPIGIEMASALNRLGVSVTLVEMQNRILPKEDEELVEELVKILQQEGVVIATGMQATKAEQQHGDITLTCINNNQVQNKITAKSLLLAVGRKPNIFTLNLHKAGVKVNKHGIEVDKRLCTSAKNIYACGDVVGPYRFSHMAWYQAVIATHNAIIPLFKRSVDYTHVIWVTFSAPELATAGLTEQDARKKYGDSIQVYRRFYDFIDRAYMDGTTKGLIKIIADKRGKILGAHILGERAGDIIHEIQLAKIKGLVLSEIYSVIHAYPTYAELDWFVAKSAYIAELKQNKIIQWLQWLFVKK